MCYNINEPQKQANAGNQVQKGQIQRHKADLQLPGAEVRTRTDSKQTQRIFWGNGKILNIMLCLHKKILNDSLKLINFM